MAELGRSNALTVIKEVDFGLYLDFNGEEILIPIKFVPEGTKPEDVIDVFVYRDSEDRLIATSQKPFGELDDFVSLVVKESTRHGAFLDWGLEKDLFVPFREQARRMEAGEHHVVRICLDPMTDRLIGVSKLNTFFSQDTSDLEEGTKVELLVYGRSDLGYNTVVDNKYSGLIYASNVVGHLNVGSKMTGFIEKVRVDGKLDIRIKEIGVNAIDGDMELVLSRLKENEGFLPVNDKSDPEEISVRLGLSKKAFKKAIGGLYKNKIITIKEEGIRII